MLRLSMKIFHSFYRQKTSAFLLISVGMFISIFGVMFVYSRGKMIYKNESQFNCETSTVKITSIVDMDDSLYPLLIDNEKLPQIHEITSLDPETDTIGHYNKGELRFTIPFGRYFQSGEENVVLLSDAYLGQVETSFIAEMLNRTIKINEHDRNYTVIGRYNATLYSDMLYSHEVIIPLKTYIKDGFPVDNLKIIFSETLSSQQISYLKSLFNKHVTSYSIVLPNSFETQALNALITETLSHFIVLLICYITLLNLLRYWIRSNRRKFYIYFMCGCSSKKLLSLLLINTCYLYLIPASISLFIFKFLEPYFYDHDFIFPLGILDCLCIYLIALSCALITTCIVTSRQIKRFTAIKEFIF